MCRFVWPLPHRPFEHGWTCQGPRPPPTELWGSLEHTSHPTTSKRISRTDDLMNPQKTNKKESHHIFANYAIGLDTRAMQALVGGEAFCSDL